MELEVGVGEVEEFVWLTYCIDRAWRREIVHVNWAGGDC